MTKLPITITLTGPVTFRDGSGTEIRGLSRRAQAMLAFLSLQPGQKAERGLLADLLWSDRPEEQARASLRQELSALRRALPSAVIEADRQSVRLCTTAVTPDVSGPGEFLEGFDLASEAFEDWLRTARMSHSATESPVPPASPVSSGRLPRLAVLPFSEIGVPETDMFADGVVEEITGALSRAREFEVIARQSAFALGNERLDIRATSERLGTDYLVEGSVQRAGDRVRISVQLVRGRDGRLLWSQRFDDRLDDLFALQDRIAAQVAGQVQPSLRAAEIDRAHSTVPTDRTAYDLVLTAMPHFWAHRQDANERAIALFGEAAARAPGYALALAYKAWALAQQATYMWSADIGADRAIALNLASSVARGLGDDPPALVALGAAFSLSSTDVALADSFIDRALAIDPNNAWGWMRKGWSAIYAGASEDALRHFDRAEKLSPLDPFRFNVVLGRAAALRGLGELDASLDLVRAGMRANPGMTWAYRMILCDLVLAGREAEARAEAREFLRHYPHATVAYVRASWPPSVLHSNPEYVDAIGRCGLPER